MHPYLLFGALLVAKKAVVGGLLVAGTRYGWPRVYRRALEAARTVAPHTYGKRGSIADLLARSMRLPGEAATILRSTDAIVAIQRASATAAETPFAKATHVAPGITLSSIFKTVGALDAKDTAKIVDVVASVAKSSAAKRAKF